MSATDLPPCSDAARERQDPMLGTAPPQRRYLLVEQDGGWGPAGFPSLDLQEEVRDEILRRTEAVDTRVMLIRRPGRHVSSVCGLRSWCVVDTRAPRGERVTWGTWSHAADLLAGVERAEELAAPRPPGTPEADGPADDDRLILVCTHGKKDVCCAVRGRPVAAALGALHPEETWECSHTGGDRFAANVLLLPDGAIYGGLDVESARNAVQAHLEGRPDTGHLRGSSGWPRTVQAAIVAVHEQLGPLPWGSVRPAATEPLEPGTGEVAATTVTLSLADGRRAAVEVREHVRPAALLTCRGDRPKVSQVPVAGPVRVVGDDIPSLP